MGSTLTTTCTNVRLESRDGGESGRTVEVGERRRDKESHYLEKKKMMMAAEVMKREREREREYVRV